MNEQDFPFIGYKNIVDISTISATSEDPDHRAVNLANPATNLYWTTLEESPETDQYLTILNTDLANVEYIGIAGHNLGTVGCILSVEDPSTSPPTQLLEPRMITTDSPIMLVFPSSAPSSISIRIQPGDAAPKIAVLYVGELLRMPTKIYTDHAPINMALNPDTIGLRSENGNFLGIVELSDSRATNYKFVLMEPDFVRDEFKPFALFAKVNPFFISWRPDTYPDEVGYIWFINKPVPLNESPSNLMSFEAQVEGVS